MGGIAPAKMTVTADRSHGESPIWGKPNSVIEGHFSSAFRRSPMPRVSGRTDLISGIAILLAMLCHPALSVAAADVPADVARYLAGLPSPRLTAP